MNFNFKTQHEFNDFFYNEKVCYEFFEGIRWNHAPVCPHCGNEKYYKVKPRGKFTDIPSYRCGNRKCDLPFTVRTKSIFEGSKIELRKWFLAAYEISTCKKSISSIELATRIGVSQKSAWFLNHRLRAMLTDTAPELLRDVVCIDETLVGGLNKNRHADKKHKNTQGGKGKAIVFGARNINGKVKTKVIPNCEIETILPMVQQWIEPGSMVVTDEARYYHSLRRDYFHVSINHSEGQYLSGAFTTNGIENFWSIFKRSIIGTFHNISRKS